MKQIIQTAIAALGAATMLSSPVAAQDADPVEMTRVRDSDEITLDPGKAYLLVEARGMFISNWFKVPTDAEREDWERQRQEELAEEIEDYPRDVRRYERALEIWQSSNGRRGRRPERPVEPTEETFVWPDLERYKVITIGPQNRFRSTDGRSLWLYEVPAGDYVFYGTGLAALSDCACMGSVRFAVSEGSVTAVRVGMQILNANGEAIDERAEGTSSTDMSTWIGLVVEGPSDDAYDPRIPRDMIRPAEFTPVPRLANWAGGTINRVMPIPGVLEYDRGRVIDVRAREAAALAEAEAAALAAEAAMLEAEAAAAAMQEEGIDEAIEPGDEGEAG